MRFRVLLLVCFFAGLMPACARPASLSSNAAKKAATASAAIDRLSIDRIDPPNWWAQFPNPMLLVHGRGLNHAHFAISGKGVSIARTQSSGNGHWAFLWLDAKQAQPQTLSIVAKNGTDEARASYVLAGRKHLAGGHAGFGPADVLYLIMPDRFADGRLPDPGGDDRTAARGWHGGDLAGIEQHLDYLQQLGVTTIWTTPVVSNSPMPESYHGYAATDLYAIDSHFGNLADYRHLSDALHARGMKLVMDMVPNHIGIDHPWIKDPPAPGWLHGTPAAHLAVQNDFYQLVDPHAASRVSLPVTHGWFTDAMPDLNQENPLVAQYLIDNALWWTETANLDGIRLDTFPYVGRAFWQQFHNELHSVYPRLTTVGEVFNRDPEVVSFFAGGAAHKGIDTGLDTPFDFPVYFTLRDVLAHGKPMTELTDVLRQDALYPHPERLVTFEGNHDTTRFVTEAGGSAAKLKLALGLIATLRGMPQIYSGDEIAMAGGADPDNRHDFPGGFPGDAHDAFTASGRTNEQSDVFNWTSGLLAYRRTHDELTTGIEQNVYVDAGSLAFVRARDAEGCTQSHPSERLLIIMNKTSQNKTVELQTGETALGGCTSFAPTKAAPGPKPELDGGKLRIEVRPETMAIYVVR